MKIPTLLVIHRAEFFRQQILRAEKMKLFFLKKILTKKLTVEIHRNFSKIYFLTVSFTECFICKTTG